MEYNTRIFAVSTDAMYVLPNVIAEQLHLNMKPFESTRTKSKIRAMHFDAACWQFGFDGIEIGWN